jgi:hypothetical protein
MNGRTGTAVAGPAPGTAEGNPAPRTRPALARGRQRPQVRPWPLFSALGPAGALPTAPGLARAYTLLVLGSWDMTRAGDLAEVSTLIVSELATNVVQAATGTDGSPAYQADGRLTQLYLRLMSDRARLRVEVWDNLPPSAGVPVLRHPTGEEEHGRGLALVERLSQDWGWDPVPGLPAKAVWALIAPGTSSAC